MKCPIDGETLIMTERHGVEIDYCPKCRGVWLDRGELDKIIEKAAGPMVLPNPDPEPMPAPPPPEPPQAAPAPRQAHEMPRYEEPRRYEDEQRYDKDRYKKAKKYRGKYSDDDGWYRKKKKRKSILAEIFDFD